MSDQFTETMSMSKDTLLRELWDTGVDDWLIECAAAGGITLIRSLYLFVMEEAAHA